MVAVVFQGSAWFFAVDALLAFVGMAAAGLIVLLSAKLLRLTKEPKFLYFTFAFSLIGGGLLVRSATNILVFVLSPYLDQLLGWELKEYRNLFFFIGYGGFIVGTILGYVLLAVSTMKTRERGVIVLLAALALLLQSLSGSYYLSFYVSSAVFLSFISFHMCQNFLQRKAASAFLVFSSFLLQLMASIAFLLELYQPLFHYVAYAALLSGYGLLLMAMGRVLLRKS